MAGLSGCGSTNTPTGTETAGATGSAGDSSVPDSTPEPTPTATPTATPEPTPTPPERTYQPQLLDVNLVSTWSEPGDITENAIDTLHRGQPAVVAYRYRMRIPASTAHFSEGVDVYDGDERILRTFEHVDREVESPGLNTWEDAMSFDTAEWPLGTLTATFGVGELQLHRNSERKDTTFELVK